MRANTCATWLNGWMRGLAGVFIVMAILISASCVSKKGTDRLHIAFRLGADYTKFVETTSVDGDNMRQDVISYKGDHYGSKIIQHYRIENQQVSQYYEFSEDGDWFLERYDEIEPFLDRIDRLVDDLVDEKRSGPQTCRDVPPLISEQGCTYRRVFWGYPQEWPLAPNGESGMFDALPDSMRADFLAAFKEKLPIQYERYHASYLRATPVYDLTCTNTVQTILLDSMRASAKEWLDMAIRCPYVLVPVPKGVDVFAESRWGHMIGQHVFDSNYGRLYFVEMFQGDLKERRK